MKKSYSWLSSCSRWSIPSEWFPTCWPKYQSLSGRWCRETHSNRFWFHVVWFWRWGFQRCWTSPLTLWSPIRTRWIRTGRWSTFCLSQGEITSVCLRPRSEDDIGSSQAVVLGKAVYWYSPLGKHYSLSSRSYLKADATCEADRMEPPKLFRMMETHDKFSLYSFWMV